MELIELQSEKPKPSFEFKNARTPGRFIFQAKDLQIGYDRPLTKPLNLTFERNQKVAIIGANGIGKTTLLKSLLGIIPPIAGEVERGDYLELGYFEQEVEGGNRQTPLEAVWNAFPALNQAEVRAAPVSYTHLDVYKRQGFALIQVLVAAGVLNLFYIQILEQIGINIILAVGLNRIVGFSGQFSLGHAGFMAIGAYSAAILGSKSPTYGRCV